MRACSTHLVGAVVALQLVAVLAAAHLHAVGENFLRNLAFHSDRRDLVFLLVSPVVAAWRRFVALAYS